MTHHYLLGHHCRRAPHPTIGATVLEENRNGTTFGRSRQPNFKRRISELQPVSKRPLPANQRKGVSFPKYFTQKLEAGRDALRRDRLGAAHCRDRQRQRRHHIRTGRRGGAGRLVPDGHQHRRQQVFLRQDGLARARAERPRSWCIAWSTPSPIGAHTDAISRRAKMPRISATNWRT